MNDKDFETLQFKIVLLGEGAVGKSSILLRYTEDKFNLQHLSTLQAAFATKKISIDSRQIELNIWDTAGQEKFHALGPIYYRDSQGAILVYDITDPKSYDRVKNWVTELKKMLGDSIVIFVVGNKIDLELERNVDKTTAEDYATSCNAHYQECSAKDGCGINLLFNRITKEMLSRANEAMIEAENRNLNLIRQGSRRSLRVINDPPLQNTLKKNKCC